MVENSIHRLNREWERLRLKYGIAESPPELDRLLLKSRRKRARLRDLRTRLSTIQTEVDALEAEVAGMDKTLRYFLSDVISRVKVDRGHAWSPVPMLGFRVWALRDDAFHGYRIRWQHRSLTARCERTNDNDNIPHTEGQCAHPPCGVYAAKDVYRIIEAHAALEVERLAVGLVAMTGKVVEHEHGWRAEEVTVLALAFVRGGRVLTAEDPDEIELLFQGVGLSAEWNCEPGTEPLPDRNTITSAIAAYMQEQERKKTAWILESPNEL